MATDIKPALLEFLEPSLLPLDILIVESVEYVAAIIDIMPQANIYVVAGDEEKLSGIIGKDGIKSCKLDYLNERLPYERGQFDYIISDLTLEFANNPQDIAAGFSMYLKETGAFLTSFRNIRHWSIIKKLMEGHYYGIVSRLFARHEFETLLYASFYKNISIKPQKRSAPAELLAQLMTAGFENFHDDLENEFYLVRADRSMPEISLLKSFYTKDDRAGLAKLLHRIEYEVELISSVEKLWKSVDELNIFADYLAGFVREIVVHPEAFYKNLRRFSEQHRDYIDEMLRLSSDKALNIDNRDR